MKVFISYRRSVSSDIVGRLRDVLVREFGEDNVFMDVYSIEVGADFRDSIRDAMTAVDALVLVIGPGLDIERLHSGADPLRLEIQEALRQGKLLLPALHGGAKMPGSADLPEAIRDLAFRNAGQLRPDPDFPRDAAAIVSRLRVAVQPGGSPGPSPPSEPGVSASVAAADQLPPPEAIVASQPGGLGGTLRRHRARGVGAVVVVGVLLAFLTWRTGRFGQQRTYSTVTSASTPSATSPAETTAPAVSTEPSAPGPTFGADELLSLERRRAGQNDLALVHEVQSILKALGHDIEVDDDYGPTTAGAVSEFQTSAGLLPTGVVDLPTLTALRTAAASTPSTTTASDQTTAQAQPPSLVVVPTRLIVKPAGPQRAGVKICGEPTFKDGNNGAEVFFEGLLVNGQSVGLSSDPAKSLTVPPSGTLTLTSASPVQITPSRSGSYPALTVSGKVGEYDQGNPSIVIGTFAYTLSPDALLQEVRTSASPDRGVDLTIDAGELFGGGPWAGDKAIREEACTRVALVLNIRLGPA